MLKDSEVRRIVDAIAEYKELVEQSSDMRDKLEVLEKRWSGLKEERNQLRAGLESLHQGIAQMKVDYQGLLKRMSDVSSTEDTILDNVKFLIDELSSLLKRHEETA
jgi:uncharacterized coiled-coil DUF342 family protein